MVIRGYTTLSFLLGFLMLAPLARAQRDFRELKKAERSIKKDKEIPQYNTVVTGKLGPEDRFTSDRSITVVTRKQISEAMPRTTPEALLDAPGTFVQQTNHGGGSPIVRGMIGPQLLLLVDGVRLSNSVYRTGPLQYLNLVDPLMIQSLEVLRGAGSMLHGSDAMGGVIQIMPHQPLDARHSDGLDGGGLVHLRNASADHGQTVHGHGDMGYGGLSVLGSVSYKHLGNLRGGGGVGSQPHTGYRAWHEAFTASYRFSDGLVQGWRIKLAYLMGHIEDAGRADKLNLASRSLQIYDNDDHLLYGRLRFLVLPLRTRGELTFSWQRFFERKHSFYMDTDLSTRLEGTRDEVTALTFGQDLRLITRLWNGNLRLRYGQSYYRDWVDAGRDTWAAGGRWTTSPLSAYPDGSTYNNYGLYVHAEVDHFPVGDGHLLRVGGGYRLHGMAGQADKNGALPAVDVVGLGHVFTLNAQYLYRELFNVAVTFSQGYRAPNLQEAVMLGDTGKFFHVPNPNLEPEQADTLELLARVQVWRARFSWAWYVTFLHDLIKRVPSAYEGKTTIAGKDVFANTNGGEGKLWGTEVLASVELWWGLSLTGHLTYTWGEEEAVVVGEPLSRIPPLHGMIKVRWDAPGQGRWRGFAEAFVRAAGLQDRLSAEDKKDVRIPAGGTPGWWTLNLRLGLVAFSHLRFGLALENLLNKKYKYHGSGVWAPGTNAVLMAEGFF